jgi:hypothetical protein
MMLCRLVWLLEMAGQRWVIDVAGELERRSAIITNTMWTRLAAAALLMAGGGCAQTHDDGPQPRAVDPGGPGRAPSDAVVLFDGNDLSHWTVAGGGPAKCTIQEGAMACKTGAGDILSKEKFRDAQIHLEFSIPNMPEQKGQLRGNSGVFLQGQYEIQVLDSYHNPTYANGSAGALYGQYAPLVNASRPPEQWQTYDVVFHAPRCGADGRVTKQGTLTLLHNGVLVQDHVEIQKATPGNSADSVCQPGPLRLQDHSGFPGAPVTVMRFRNIWFRPVD